MFQAPEALKGEGYGLAADVWACGVTLFLLAPRSLPVWADSMDACLDMVGGPCGGGNWVAWVGGVGCLACAWLGQLELLALCVLRCVWGGGARGVWKAATRLL